jgi:hypothetical protein
MLLPRTILLAACLIAATAAAAPPRKANRVDLIIDGETVLVVKSLPFSIKAPAGADFYDWTIPPGVTAEKAGHVLTVTKAAEGTHTFRMSATTVSFTVDKETFKVTKTTTVESGEVVVNVGKVTPGPGPGPKPDPDPPTPAPGPVTGLRVMIVYESSAKMTREQLNLLNSTKLREWLKKNAADYRFWDKDNTPSDKEKPIWHQLWKDSQAALKTTGIPALVLVSDQRGETVPLPESEAAGLKFLEEWAKGKKSPNKKGK